MQNLTNSHIKNRVGVKGCITRIVEQFSRCGSQYQRLSLPVLCPRYYHQVIMFSQALAKHPISC